MYKNAQDFLKAWYPNKQTTKSIDEIDGTGDYKMGWSAWMSGELTIKDYPNLELLSIGHGRITKLEIINCPKLTQLGCENNELTTLDLSGLNQLTLVIANDNKLESIKLPTVSEKLTHLNIVNNNLPKQDLSVFSRFINLEQLWIGNNKDGKLQYDICNRFAGSLESLKDMNKLEVLDISNTHVDSGLEHLSRSIDYLVCIAEWNLPIERLEKELKKFGKPINTNYAHLLRIWRMNYEQEKMKEEIKSLRIGSSNLQGKEITKFKTKQELEEIIRNKKLEIEELEEQLNDLQIQTYIEQPPK